MAQGGVGFERQPVRHHMLGPEIPVDRPLKDAALQGKTGNL
jgi:hypothetical protein